jgi:mannose-1-phosphate guanylyltransferase
VAKDPEAMVDEMVIVMPSDHYVRDDDRFVESVERAVSFARSENAIVLVGAVPDGPETEYGWISCAPHAAGRPGRVLGFVEKPAPARANELFRAGALWNTFIMVGSAARFMALARRNLPSQFALFSVYQRSVGKPWARSVLTSVYERLTPADFSRDVLQESEDQLCAVPLSPCGWSDWGTPERVLRSLRGTPRFDALCERLRTSTNVEQAQGVGLAVAV